MVGYTERPAFYQLIQIILLSIALGMESYSYSVDLSFDRVYKKQQNFICLHLLTLVDRVKYSSFIQPVLDSPQYWSNGKVIQPSTNLEYSSDVKYFRKHVGRGSDMEKTAISLIFLSNLLLIVHLTFACVSSNYLYRTKWTAAAQGMVMYMCAFSSMLLAISANNYDFQYSLLAQKFPECRLLHLCSHHDNFEDSVILKLIDKHGFTKGSNATLENIRKMMKSTSLCQEFKLKEIVAWICCSTIGLCVIIICSAMDLTTLYDEEDVDEEEKMRREAVHSHALAKKAKKNIDSSRNSLSEEEENNAPREKIKGKKHFSKTGLSKASKA